MAPLQLKPCSPTRTVKTLPIVSSTILPHSWNLTRLLAFCRIQSRQPPWYGSPEHIPEWRASPRSSRADWKSYYVNDVRHRRPPGQTESRTTRGGTACFENQIPPKLSMDTQNLQVECLTSLRRTLYMEKGICRRTWSVTTRVRFRRPFGYVAKSPSPVICARMILSSLAILSFYTSHRGYTVFVGTFPTCNGNIHRLSEQPIPKHVGVSCELPTSRHYWWSCCYELISLIAHPYLRHYDCLLTLI